MREIFKDIPGYEGLYQISDLGRVNSLKFNKQRILKIALDDGGYCIVSLYNLKQATLKIHKLVAIAFLNHVPCGHKTVVDHIDFDKTNNKLSNLRLITQRENSNQKQLKSTSKHIGVHWHKKSKKWKSEIWINGANAYLGCFKNEIDASNAYQKAKNKLCRHGNIYVRRSGL